MIIAALVLIVIAVVIMVMGLRSGVYHGGTRRERVPYAVPSIACLVIASVLLAMTIF